jgi:uridine kinase
MSNTLGITFKNIFVDRYGNNKIKDIFESRLFWTGVVIKITLACLFASNFLTDLFIPFTNNFAQNPFHNPYSDFFSKGESNIFPYPALMLYVLSTSRLLFSFINWNSITFLDIFLFKIPLFLADFIILLVLYRLIRKDLNKIIIYYWLSPVLIYINYIHGQLDVIPISLLFISIYFVVKNKFYYSSLFLGLAVATKTSILLVIPFYIIYLCIKGLNKKDVILNSLIIPAVFILINLPYIFSYEFFQLVFNNKEQYKIFDFIYNFGDNKILYLVPFSYIILLIQNISLRTSSKDVFIMFVGFSFGVITLFIPPMQGWYYWIIPFFAYFFIKANGRFGILFAGLQGGYFLYFGLINTSDYLRVFQVISNNISNLPNLYEFLMSYNIDAKKLSNLSFTILQALLLSNCILIYRLGIKIYSNHKITSKPYIVGICGDSGAGKTTLSNSLETLFGSKLVNILHGDDMHKWERGDENWKTLTHLNPKANYLHEEISYLKSIKNGCNIQRQHYDHDTGKFTKKHTIKSKNITIFEGLHSFYIKQMRDLYDLKIFISLDDNLRKHWKIIRDIKKRGYSKERILEQLSNRENDSSKFIKSQIKYADIVIEVLPQTKIASIGDIKEKVKTRLRIKFVNSIYIEPLVKYLEGTKTIKSKHTYEEEDMQVLDIEGKISSEEISQIIYNICSEQDIFDMYNLECEDNYNGIMQLVVFYCMITTLKNTQNEAQDLV